MLKTGRTFLAAGLVALAGTAALGFGYDGSLDGVASAISGAVSAGNKSALKMQNWLEKPSDRLSKDFVTFSKVAREAGKGDFAVLSEGTLSEEFDGLVSQSTAFGMAALQRVVDAAAGDPVKLARIMKKHARYLAKQAKFIAKYDEVWGDPTDESKVSLAKAAIYYAAIQRLYESIDKAFPAPG